MDIGPLIIAIAVSYLIGSIPFGLLLTRICGCGDIRNIGSGNIGATNVLRTGKKGLAIATLLLDLLKGLVAVKFGAVFGIEFAAGLCAVLGHVYPVWLKFRGGKGVATALGVIFGINWLVAAIMCLIWLVVFFISRISSLSALVCFSASPVIAYFTEGINLTGFCLMLALIIIFTHRHNLARLMNGTEMAFKKKSI